MKVTIEELKRLEGMDVRRLRREDLDHAGEIAVDRTKPADRRMAEFLEKTKNPYAENVGDYVLMVSFSKGETMTLEDRLVQLARKMTRIPL
ncbi:MAG: hypothetical protein LUI39_12245 [Lachnospiraceae bacterium]|nr:hypothetical protein [Lachnospiraceae bacterium]